LKIQQFNSMKKVKFDITKVLFEEISGEKKPVGEVIPNFAKQVAEFFYYNTSNLELSVFAMDLYKSDVVEVNREQLDGILKELPKLTLLNPVLKSFKEVVNGCLAELDLQMSGDAAAPKK